MPFWQALVIAVVPSVAAVLTAALGFRDLGMRRRLQTSEQFLNLFATAHGRPVDGRDGVGLSEQIATIHLIADFAASESLLRNAARAGLGDFATWGDGIEATPQELAPLLTTLPEDKVVEAAAQAIEQLKRSSASRRKIADAAAEALQRLN